MGTRVYNTKKQLKLNVADYVNMDTGEELSSELHALNATKVTVLAKNDNKIVTLKSDDYIIIDQQGLKYLAKKLTRSELGDFIIIAADLKTNLNIVYNNNIPHTNRTLQKELEYKSESSYYKTIKKFIEVGILFKASIKVLERTRTVYMMNPMLARKRSTIDKTVLEAFQHVDVKCLY